MHVISPETSASAAQSLIALVTFIQREHVTASDVKVNIFKYSA